MNKLLCEGKLHTHQYYLTKATKLSTSIWYNLHYGPQ